MTFHPLVSLAVLSDGYRQVFTIDGVDYLLLQHEGQRYLLENDCPHAAYPLQAGMVADGGLRCPMHGYVFSLQTGECTYYTEGPCRALKRIDLVVQDDHLGIML